MTSDFAYTVPMAKSRRSNDRSSASVPPICAMPAPTTIGQKRAGMPGRPLTAAVIASATTANGNP